MEDLKDIELWVIEGNWNDSVHNTLRKPDSKCSTSFTTASSPLILHVYQSQQKTDRATERTTHTATTSPPSPGLCPTGTACPRTQWQPSPWAVSSPDMLHTCNHDTPPPPTAPAPPPFFGSTIPSTILHTRSIQSPNYLYCHLHKSAYSSKH